MTEKRSLVERLLTADGLVVPYAAAKLMAQAANEIERLRLLLADRHERGCSIYGEVSFPCDCGALDFCLHEERYQQSGQCINCGLLPDKPSPDA